MSGQTRRRMKESICVSRCIKSRSDPAVEAVKANRTAPQQPVGLNHVLYDLFIAVTTPNWIAFFVIAATEKNMTN